MMMQITDIYDKEFAIRFIQIVADVKEYVDNECASTLEDLQKKHGRQ